MGNLSRLALLALIAMTPGVQAETPERDLLDDPTVQQHKVLSYLMLHQDSNLVVVNAGKRQGVVSGATFKAYRQARAAGSVGVDSINVEMGTLKALDVQDGRTIAAVVVSGSDLATAFFPKFPKVMAGDTVVMQRLSLNRNMVLTPSLSLSYSELFDDPGSNPRSFELSESGKDKLRRSAEQFGSARMLQLFVEGHTDGDGPADVNQVESLQRAKTVRQFLIEDQSFESDRLVALGFGESEPAELSGTPGAAQSNRRIVLKVVPEQL